MRDESDGDDEEYTTYPKDKNLYSDFDSDNDIPVKHLDNENVDNQCVSSPSDSDDTGSDSDSSTPFKKQDKHTSCEKDKTCDHTDKIKYRIIVPCCGDIYDCLKCHNQQNDHVCNRYDIKKIICSNCGKQQKLTSRCTLCRAKFAKMYCKKCKLHSSEHIFHCSKCKKCYYGYKAHYIHCDSCKCCMSNKLPHICVPNKLDEKCPICIDKLSDSELCTLKCGHVIHYECYVDLIKFSSKCPNCAKTIKPMKKQYAEYDKLVKEDKADKSLSKNKTTVEIHCNDCEEKSNVIFNYIGLKCKHCKSYNTYQL